MLAYTYHTPLPCNPPPAAKLVMPSAPSVIWRVSAGWRLTLQSKTFDLNTLHVTTIIHLAYPPAPPPSSS